MADQPTCSQVLQKILDSYHRPTDEYLDWISANLPEDPKARQAIEVLIENLRGHFHEEETWLFPILRKAEQGQPYSKEDLQEAINHIFAEHRMLFELLDSAEMKSRRAGYRTLANAMLGLRAHLSEHSGFEDTVLLPICQQYI